MIDGHSRERSAAALAAGLLALLAAACGDAKRTPSPEQWEPRPNPYMAEGVVGQVPSPASVNTSSVAGPTGPTRTLSQEEIQYAEVGPGHYAGHISSPYADGQRVIWTKGTDRISKLDYDGLGVLASYPLPGRREWTAEEFFAAYEEILAALPDERGARILALGAQTQTLVGAYTVLDRDNVLYVGYERSVVAYADAGEPGSPIAAARSWVVPVDIPGNTVGMNLTYDGRLVFATEQGYVVVLERDFSAHRAVALPHHEEAAASPNAWVRNSVSLDEDGGLYVVSNGYMHKVVWRPEDRTLSAEPVDGAWSEPYRNGLGTGSGSTPALVGFGPRDDRLVAITDGDPLMNLTVFWRDTVPDGWQPPAGSPSRRIAGLLPANFGDPEATAAQNEQQVLVAGYTMMIGQNDPASLPVGLPYATRVLAVGFVANDPAITPHGVQALRWNASARALEAAWANRELSAGSCVPRGSSKSNLAYWIGVRDGGWTLEGVDIDTGELAFHQTLPAGVKYNNLFSGVLLDNQGHVLFGTSFGFARLPKR